jgi:hypothetical protein
MQLGEPLGDRPRVIARWRLLLLIGCLVFLVDDDQADRPQRDEERGAWADHHGGLSLVNRFPNGRPLALAQAAVDQNRPTGKACRDTLDDLGRQGDLRDQDDRLPTPPDALADRSEIEFGFAAPRHAVQEERARRILVEHAPDRFPCLLLLRCERERAIGTTLDSR